MLLPEVGGDMAAQVNQTVEAVRAVARHIAAHEPDTLVVMSPHGPLLRDRMAIGTAGQARGHFGNFNAPQVQLQVDCDTELVRQLQVACDRVLIPVHGVDSLTGPGSDGSFYFLDHGAAVPLHFILPMLGPVRVVLLGFSYLPRGTHLSYGARIREVCDASGKRIVFVASGDLSHRLLPSGPYGFDPRGPAFDETIVSALGRQDWEAIVNVPEEVVEGAGVCGYLSLLTLLGALRRDVRNSKMLSYEGPFGVGYAVAEMTPRAAKRQAASRARGTAPKHAEGDRAGESTTAGEPKKSPDMKSWAVPQQGQAAPEPAEGFPSDAPAAPDFSFPEGDLTAQIVALARASFQAYARSSRRLLLPLDLPPAFQQQRACFVTLRLDGKLRGCVGTIVPTRQTLAHEIVENAIGAASRDYRFTPVTVADLPGIVCSVDVLSAPEPVTSRDMLDPASYGMVVIQGQRVGVLLPALPEVTTPEQQYEICLQKAGISTQTDIGIYRFEVVRYAEPGAEH
ncbi:MAG: AmmeMemoRadiSam system protein A [Chloroflexota bacterium]|nr:AmmeMemoRadiSam system protein A [Chloroflexota bacterium]